MAEAGAPSAQIAELVLRVLAQRPLRTIHINKCCLPVGGISVCWRSSLGGLPAREKSAAADRCNMVGGHATFAFDFKARNGVWLSWFERKSSFRSSADVGGFDDKSQGAIQ
jgi:hypothetical protein